MQSLVEFFVSLLLALLIQILPHSVAVTDFSPASEQVAAGYVSLECSIELPAQKKCGEQPIQKYPARVSDSCSTKVAFS